MNMSDKNKQRWLIGIIVVAVVVIIWLLMRKFAGGGGGVTNYALSPPQVQMYGLTPNNINVQPPNGYDVNVSIPVTNTQSSCDCGCGGDDLGIGTANELMDYFAQNLKDVTQAYNATLIAAIPTYLLQYWNNPGAFLNSQYASQVL